MCIKYKSPPNTLLSKHLVLKSFYSLGFMYIHFVTDDLIHFCKGHLTPKSDVYSFGVVLLEVLSGKKAIDKNRPPGEHNLVEWAKPCLTSKRRIFRVLDPRLEGQYSLGRALKLANLALQCLSTEPKTRPSMDEVVSTLEELQGGEKRERREDPHVEPAGNKARSCGHEVGTGLVAYPRPSASLRG